MGLGSPTELRAIVISCLPNNRYPGFKVVAYRNLLPSTTLHGRKNRCDLRSSSRAAYVYLLLPSMEGRDRLHGGGRQGPERSGAGGRGTEYGGHLVFPPLGAAQASLTG